MFCCWVLNLHFHVPFPVSNLRLDLPGVCLAEMRYVYDVLYFMYGINFLVFVWKTLIGYSWQT